MNLAIKTRIMVGMAYGQVEAHQSAIRYGYWEKKRNMGEAIALIHRDAAKALEIITVGDGPSGKLTDVTRLEEALANVIIRCLDVAGGMDLRLGPAVISKLEYNEAMSKLAAREF